MSKFPCVSCGVLIERKSKNHKYCKKCGIEAQIENRMQYSINMKLNFPEIEKENHKRYYLKNRDELKKKRHDYYVSNKDKIREYEQLTRSKKLEYMKKYNKKYIEKNKYKLKTYGSMYRSANRDRMKLYRSEYYKKNSAKAKERATRFKKTDKGIRISKITNRKRRARENSIIEVFSQEEWIEMVNNTAGICPQCNIFVGTDKLCLDHIYPISKAERCRVYTINDIQPLCRSCNASKADKVTI